MHLTRKLDVASKFLNARPVPYVLRKKVGRNSSSCGRKHSRAGDDGSICSLYFEARWPNQNLQGFQIEKKNKATYFKQYPFPKIEDLYSQLSGGNSFTMLLLRVAYCQLELDEKSKDLL